MFSDKQQRYIFAALLIVSAILYFAHLKMWSIQPIYSDEISYRFFTTRAMLDDWKRIALFPTCVSSAYLPIPLVFYPAAFVLSLYAHITDMQLYRYFGMAVFTTTLSLACLTAYTFIQRKYTHWLAAAFVLTLLALFSGVLPSILFMVRPEHIIFLAVIFACWIATRSPATHWAAALAQIFFVLLFFAMAIYTHPKAIYFAPGVALVIALRLRQWLPLALATAALLIVIVGSSIHINMIQFMHCPENPALEKAISNQNINPMDAVKAPLDFIERAFALNLDRSWSALANKMTFSNQYDGGGSTGYLPPADDGTFFVKMVNTLVVSSEIITVIFAFGFIFLNMRSVVNALRSAKKGERLGALLSLDKAAFPLLLSINYLCLLVQFLLNRNQVFYDVGFWLVLLVFFNGLSLVYHWTRSTQIKHEAVWRGVMILLFSVQALCAVLSCTLTASTIYQTYLNDKEVLGVPLHNYEKMDYRGHTQEVLKMCGLRDDTPKLVHDDFTYPYLQKSYYPLSVSWTFAALLDEAHVLPWFKEIGASGIVIDCRTLRSAFKFPEKRISVSGPVCCVNLSDDTLKK